jgi:hypothetical protein
MACGTSAMKNDVPFLHKRKKMLFVYATTDDGPGKAGKQLRLEHT